jgi:hypothetical protein
MIEVIVNVTIDRWQHDLSAERGDRQTNTTFSLLG